MADRDRKKFKFRGTSEKTVAARSTDTGSWDRYTKSKYPVYKVKDGENEIRILPRTWDDTERWGDSWGLPLKLHYSVGPDNGTYLCNKLNEKRCYLCDERVALQDDEEAAKALRPGDRVLCWIIDRKDEKAGPQLYAMPKSKVEVDIQLLSRDEKTGEILQITDPDEGYDVTFTKKGSNLNTDYKGVRIARSSSPVHDKESRADEWLDFVEANPLPDVLNFYDNEYLESIYSGKSSKRKDGDDEDEEGAPSRERRGRDEKENEPTDRDRSERSRSSREDHDSERRPSRTRDDGADGEEDVSDKIRRISRSDLDDMDEAALTKLIKKYDLDVDPEDYPRESALREAVSEALDETDLLEEPAIKKDRSAQARESVERLKRRAAADEEKKEDEPRTRSRRSRDDD